MTKHNHQRITTASGLELLRAYVYLPESVWNDLYAVSKDSGISASQYICNLITTANNGTVEKDKHDSTTLSVARSE